jgi:hypothetical protein
MAKLSSLVVDLQVQSAQLKAGLDQANKKIDAFAKHAESASKMLGELFSFEILKEAGEKLGEFVMKGAEAAAQLGKMAQAAGAPVEQMSKLGFAANLAGISTEELGTALQKLSKHMAEAEGGNKQQDALFKALGVSITDASGRLRSSTEVFGDVAEAFSKLEDGAAKTALAQDLFGKSGARMIPLLNEGRDALKAQADEMERMGLTLTKAQTEGAEGFLKSLHEVGLIVTNVATRVAADLGPSLKALLDDLINAATKTDFLKDSVSMLAGGIRALVSAGIIVSSVFQGLADSLAATGAVVSALLKRDFAGAQLMEDRLRDLLRKNAEDTKRRLEVTWDKNPPKGPGDYASEQEAKAKEAADKIVKHLARMEAAQKRAAENLKRNESNFEGDVKNGLDKIADSAKGQVTLGKTKAGILQGQRDRVDSFTGANPMLGFADFGDALSKATGASLKEASLREQIRVLERDHAFDAAKALEELADRAHEAGEHAKKAADAFQALAEAQHQARQAIVDKITPKGVSDLVGAGKQGNLAAGGGNGAAGVLGAVGGVFLELLTKSKQFGQVMEKVDAVVQSFADVIGIVLEPLLPVFDMLTKVAKPLAPIFKLIGDVVESVITAIAGVWNGLMTVLDFLTGWAGTDFKNWKINLDDLNTSTTDAADANDHLADAADKAAASLTNVPAGFRTELARFNASDPTLIGGAAAGGDRPGSVDPGYSRIQITVNGSTDPDAVAALVEKRLRMAEQRRTGRAFPSAPAFGT